MLIDCHALLKSKTVKARPFVPWYTAEIGAAKRLRRKAERQWRKTGRQEDFHAFKVQRNRLTYMMNTAKKDFYTKFIAEDSMVQGKLLRAAKRLLAKKEDLFLAMRINLFLRMTSENFYPQNRIHPLGY